MSGHGQTLLNSSRHYVFYSSFPGDKDLQADGPPFYRGKLMCRRIVPFTSGNLVVTRPDDTDVTLTGVVAFQILDIQAKKIKSSGTTITSALVHW